MFGYEITKTVKDAEATTAKGALGGERAGGDARSPQGKKAMEYR